MDGTKTRNRDGGARSQINRDPTEAVLRRVALEASRSPDGEAYRELAHGPCYRLGIAVKARARGTFRFSMVVLVESPVWANRRGRAQKSFPGRLQAGLTARGYPCTRLDNGWMVYERSCRRPHIAAEWRFLRELTDATRAGAGGDRGCTSS